MTAGSRMLCMVYEKYVLDLKWRIQLFPQCQAELPEPSIERHPTEPSLVLLGSLALWLQVRREPQTHSLFILLTESLVSYSHASVADKQYPCPFCQLAFCRIEQAETVSCPQQNAPEAVCFAQYKPYSSPS